MFATKISSTALIQANQPIGLDNSPMINSNNNVILNEDNNGILIIEPGLYKVKIQLNLFTIVSETESSGNAGVVFYVNGEKLNESEFIISFSESTASEVTLEYPINVIKSEDADHVLIQFYSAADATLRNGFITVERVV
ncbi:MAG: hypothetical protein MJ235_07710 [archaeon]|nr:hypothetical protein [archaeon]